jgi:hypothetical protein
MNINLVLLAGPGVCNYPFYPETSDSWSIGVLTAPCFSLVVAIIVHHGVYFKVDVARKGKGEKSEKVRDQRSEVGSQQGDAAKG